MCITHTIINSRCIYFGWLNGFFFLDTPIRWSLNAFLWTIKKKVFLTITCSVLPEQTGTWKLSKYICFYLFKFDNKNESKQIYIFIFRWIYFNKTTAIILHYKWRSKCIVKLKQSFVNQTDGTECSVHCNNRQICQIRRLKTRS